MSPSIYYIHYTKIPNIDIDISTAVAPTAPSAVINVRGRCVCLCVRARIYYIIYDIVIFFLFIFYRLLEIASFSTNGQPLLPPPHIIYDVFTHVTPQRQLLQLEICVRYYYIYYIFFTSRPGAASRRIAYYVIYSFSVCSMEKHFTPKRRA